MYMHTHTLSQTTDTSTHSYTCARPHAHTHAVLYNTYAQALKHKQFTCVNLYLCISARM